MCNSLIHFECLALLLWDCWLSLRAAGVLAQKTRGWTLRGGSCGTASYPGPSLPEGMLTNSKVADGSAIPDCVIPAKFIARCLDSAGGMCCLPEAVPCGGKEAAASSSQQASGSASPVCIRLCAQCCCCVPLHLQEALFTTNSEGARPCHCSADCEKDSETAAAGVWLGCHDPVTKGQLCGGSQAGSHLGLMCSLMGLHSLWFPLLPEVRRAGAAAWGEPAPPKVEDSLSVAAHLPITRHLLQLSWPCQDGLFGAGCVHRGDPCGAVRHVLLACCHQVFSEKGRLGVMTCLRILSVHNPSHTALLRALWYAWCSGKFYCALLEHGLFWCAVRVQGRERAVR